MKTVTCLTFIAIGAIFTFAVTAHPSFLNLQIAGLVVMATGVAGVVLPRRGQEGWLRRRMVLRTGARGPVVGHVEETRFPPTSCSTRERPAPRARRRIMRGRRPAAHEQEIPCVRWLTRPS